MGMTDNPDFLGRYFSREFGKVLDQLWPPENHDPDRLHDPVTNFKIYQAGLNDVGDGAYSIGSFATAGNEAVLPVLGQVAQKKLVTREQVLAALEEEVRKKPNDGFFHEASVAAMRYVGGLLATELMGRDPVDGLPKGFRLSREFERYRFSCQRQGQSLIVDLGGQKPTVGVMRDVAGNQVKLALTNQRHIQPREFCAAGEDRWTDIRLRNEAPLQGDPETYQIRDDVSIAFGRAVACAAYLSVRDQFPRPGNKLATSEAAPV